MEPNQRNQQKFAQQVAQQITKTNTGVNRVAAVADTGPTARPKPTLSNEDSNSSKKSSKNNPNSTQNMLQIAEIRDGIVIMSDGSYRSVIMVKPTNFDLMSIEEKQAVEYSFQGFLNTLYFPIQIFIHSERVDLGPYIERLIKIRSQQNNMLLGLLMDDYLEFIDELGGRTNLMNKKFYIIVPYFPVVDVQKSFSQSKNFFTGLVDMFGTKQAHVVINESELEKAKDELKNRVQSLLTTLQDCGILGIPLDTQELIELYYNTYNPDVATHQPLHSYDDLSSPIVSKGDGFAAQPNLDTELPS